jgi:hypothetical protein
VLRERASFSAASGRGCEPCLTAPRWLLTTLARPTISYYYIKRLTSCARAGAHEHFTSPSQDSTWRSTDRCTATHNVNVQHRRASANQTVAIATLSFMKVSASTPFFRLASKHCSAGPITRQKWSEGFRQRQNFGSLFFSSDLVTSHRNASVGMQFVGFTGREGFFRHRNLCLRPPHATDLDGFRARASKKIMAGVASLADDVELTEMCSAISNT